MKIRVKYHAPSSHYIEESMIGCVHNVGSYMKDGIVASGLTLQEEKVLLPMILEEPYGSVQYSLKKTEFLTNIKLRIAYGESEILDTTLHNPDQQFSELNVPKNPHDYFMWKFLLTHPKCAPSPDEATSKHLFVLVDEAEERERVDRRSKLFRDTVMKIDSIESHTDADVVIYALAIIMPTRLDISALGEMTLDSKKAMLTDLANSDAETLNSVLNNENLKQRGQIGELIASNIITYVDGFYVRGGITLGRTVDEVLINLKDPAYSKTAAELKLLLNKTKTLEA